MEQLSSTTPKGPSIEFTREQKIIGGTVLVAHLAAIALGLAIVAGRTINFQAIQQAGQNFLAPLLRAIH